MKRQFPSLIMFTLAIFSHSLFAIEPTVPIIQDTDLELCRNIGSAGKLASGTGLFRVDIDTNTYPNASCNDGTGAVIYVRRAQQTEYRNNWVIYLQGGGACRDGQSCAERYCSSNNVRFGAWKMSSLDVPEIGIKGTGIQSRNVRNHFRDWNQVHVHYCSSDGWGGRASDVVMQAVDPSSATTTSIDYRIHFHGADIVDAVVDTLRQDAGVVTYIDSYNDNHPEQQMPDLDQASVVLLAGSSAGSGGVRRNVDRVREYLEAHNLACQQNDCPLDIRAIIDAGTGPRLEDYGFTSSSPCTALGLCDYDSFMQDAWNNTSLSIWNEDTDASCLSYHAGIDEWRCADTRHVMEHHLSTPFFVRMDLQDNLVMNNAIKAMYDIGGVPVNEDLWGRKTLQDLLELRDLDQTAEEGSVMSGGDALAEPGLFAPQCGNHSSLRGDNAFIEAQAPVIPNGFMLTTNQVLANWVRGIGLTQALVPFSAPGILASCP